MATSDIVRRPGPVTNKWTRALAEMDPKQGQDIQYSGSKYGKVFIRDSFYDIVKDIKGDFSYINIIREKWSPHCYAWRYSRRDDDTVHIQAYFSVIDDPHQFQHRPEWQKGEGDVAIDVNNDFMFMGLRVLVDNHPEGGPVIDIDLLADRFDIISQAHFDYYTLKCSLNKRPLLQ
jgi:hypothetical protein